jgi:hypothetical protein
MSSGKSLHQFREEPRGRRFFPALFGDSDPLLDNAGQLYQNLRAEKYLIHIAVILAEILARREPEIGSVIPSSRTLNDGLKALGAGLPDLRAPDWPGANRGMPPDGH